VKKHRIRVDLGCFTPGITIEIMVPESYDAEEYIDELLDGILNDNLRYNTEWNFVD